MKGFLDECRTEWKRLGVSTSAADEMAAELTADLAEAEAEGASAEDVLGASASDPRAFAAAWAAERGVIRPSRGRRARRLLMAAAIAAFALVAVAGAVLVAVSSAPESRRLAVESPDGRVRVIVLAPNVERRVVVAPRPFVFGPDMQTPIPVPAAGPVAISTPTEETGFDARIPGLLLLAVGLAGVLTLTLLGLVRAPRPAV
jgi:branched-subunit amino acid ABC-type transport system permease component